MTSFIILLAKGTSVVTPVGMHVTALENAAWTVLGTSYILLEFQFHLASRECGMIMLWIPAGQKNQQNNYMQQVLSCCYSECWWPSILTVLLY